MNRAHPAMCDECQQLVDASPSTPAHENLMEYRSSPLSNHPAPTDERYFLCNVCEQDWTLESRGRGWLAAPRQTL